MADIDIRYLSRFTERDSLLGFTAGNYTPLPVCLWVEDGEAGVEVGLDTGRELAALGRAWSLPPGTLPEAANALLAACAEALQDLTPPAARAHIQTQVALLWDRVRDDSFVLQKGYGHQVVDGDDGYEGFYESLTPGEVVDKLLARRLYYPGGVEGVARDLLLPGLMLNMDRMPIECRDQMRPRQAWLFRVMLGEAPSYPARVLPPVDPGYLAAAWLAGTPPVAGRLGYDFRDALRRLPRGLRDLCTVARVSLPEPGLPLDPQLDLAAAWRETGARLNAHANAGDWPREASEPTWWSTVDADGLTCHTATHAA